MDAGRGRPHVQTPEARRLGHEGRQARAGRLPAAAGTTPHSFLNDLAVDLKHQAVYIADEGIGAGGDGFLYVSAAQLHLAAPFTGGKGENKPPYLIFRLKPLARGEVGK